MMQDDNATIETHILLSGVKAKKGQEAGGSIAKKQAPRVLNGAFPCRAVHHKMQQV